MTRTTVLAGDMIIGGAYNFPGRKERLKYIGYNFSSNGFWHQFEMMDKPGEVWCEMTDDDLSLVEKTV